MMDKFKNALDKGVASVSVKSNVFVENTKISTQINNLKNNINQTKTEMANTIYAVWSAGTPVQQAANSYCAAIADMERQIEQLKQKMEQVKTDSRQILGEKGVQNTCGNCGIVNDAAAKFCVYCGKKLI